MAYKVTSPGRGEYEIPSSPSGSYESVASKYAADFREALRAEKRNELNSKILAWQRGDLNWEELSKYLDDRISAAKDNSGEKVSLLETQAKLENQKREMFESEQATKVANKRTELMQQYMGEGITNEERLDIVTKLKEIADPESSTYQDLVSEEAEIRTAIQEEQERAAQAGAGRAAKENYYTKMAKIKNLENQLDFEKRDLKIGGMRRDVLRKQNAEKMADLVRKAMESGVSVSRSDVEFVENYLSAADRMLDLRKAGAVADVVNADNELVTVSTEPGRFGNQIVISDDGSVSQGPAANINKAVRYDPRYGWGVDNPKTGKFERTRSKREALAKAQEGGYGSYDVIMYDEAGRPIPREMARDEETGVFYEKGSPQKAYARLPTSNKQARDYLIENIPENWLENPDVKSDVGQMVKEGQYTSVDYEYTGPEVPTAFTSTGYGDGLDLGKKAPETPSAEKVTPSYPGVSPLGGFGEVTEQPTGTITPERTMQGPQKGSLIDIGRGLAERGVGLGPLNVKPKLTWKPAMPDISFETPEFSMPDFKKFTPSPPVFARGTPQTTRPKPVSTKTKSSGPKGFLGQAQKFGQNLLGGIRGLFGGK